MAIGAMTGCGDPLSGSRDPGIQVVAGGPRADTIAARLTPDLTVYVNQESRRAAVGRVVRFEAVPMPNPRYQGSLEQRLAFIVGQNQFSGFAADTTDDVGAASTRIWFGATAGIAPLIVSVPELGYIDTLIYTVLPGTATSVRVSPADTAVYVGASFTPQARVLDWAENVRDDPTSLIFGSGPVSLNAASGIVTATAIGRAAIIARSANLADTAFVSIVPQGWVATQEFDPGNGGPRGLFLMQLDGSGRQRIAAGLDNSFIAQGFEWSPDGQQLALVRGPYINLLRPGGPERPIVEMAGGIVTATRFSRDGQWIYFAHGGFNSQRAGLYRVRIDGSELQPLGETGNHYFAAPSHDGQSVAYVSGDHHISVLDIAKNRNRTYAGQSYLALGKHVAWSPTEDLIAYDSGTDLMLVRSDGTQSRTLGAGVTRVKWMDFSPDGRWLLVAQPGVTLFEVPTGLKLPLGQFANYGATAWRP
jgi:hypothetical protein